MKKLFLVIALSFEIIISHAQNLSQTVKGTITDKISEKPLVGASVSVEGNSLSSLTAANGVFVMRNVPVGRIKINISFIGY